MFFVCFFVDSERVRHIKMGGKFLLPEYGVFILPRNGTTVAFFTSTVIHCTNVTHGYDNIGMSYLTKCNVQIIPQHKLKRSYHYLKIISTTQYFYYSSISIFFVFLLCLIIIYRLCAYWFIFLTCVVVICLFCKWEVAAKKFFVQSRGTEDTKRPHLQEKINKQSIRYFDVVVLFQNRLS